MQSRPHTYLFRIQYLGLRYHGWHVQKGVKTIQGILEKTFRYVLGHEDFNVLGASRTDSGVSCLNGAFELFLREPVDIDDVTFNLNLNLPTDIRILNGRKVPPDFNIIQDVAFKQYGYYFAMGEKPHPFLAGSLAFAGDGLDLMAMQKGATIFQGKQDFRRFCTHGKQTEDFVRELSMSEIVSSMPDPFWPNNETYVFRVRGKGFLMHQVRRMMTALIMLGKGEISITDLVEALHSQEKSPLIPKAPANGLVLEELSFLSLNE